EVPGARRGVRERGVDHRRHQVGAAPTHPAAGPYRDGQPTPSAVRGVASRVAVAARPSRHRGLAVPEPGVLPGVRGGRGRRPQPLLPRRHGVGHAPGARAVSATLDWFGCATFRLTVGDVVVFLDAYVDRVPGAPGPGLTADDVDRADWILVGHSHFDHLWGAERI